MESVILANQITAGIAGEMRIGRRLRAVVRLDGDFSDEVKKRGRSFLIVFGS